MALRPPLGGPTHERAALAARSSAIVALRPKARSDDAAAALLVDALLIRMQYRHEYGVPAFTLSNGIPFKLKFPDFDPGQQPLPGPIGNPTNMIDKNSGRPARTQRRARQDRGNSP